MKKPISWSVSAGRVATVLAAIAVVLTFISVLGVVTTVVSGRDHLLGLIPLFDVDHEANIPTWYSSLLLLVASALLAAHARHAYATGDRFRRHWAGLAVIFGVASIDETAMLHERVSALLRGLRAIHPTLHFAWVAPAIALVVLLALVYARFLLALPKASRVLFVVAATLYVGGAVGIEMLSGRQAALHGTDSIGYRLIAHVEELAEMLGVVVFVYALLRSAEERFAEVRLAIAPRVAAAAETIETESEPANDNLAPEPPAHASVMRTRAGSIPPREKMDSHG